MRKTVLSLLIFAGLQVAAETSAERGLLPEIKLGTTDEESNQNKALHAEVMITKTEQEAIATLQKIILKRKGTPEEASLLYRLAELEMRRAKSGRFFDLFRDVDKMQQSAHFVAPQIRDQTATSHLKEAVKIYNRIAKDFPKFEEMDAVYFNCAFANQQMALNSVAESLYLKLVQEFPSSSLLPDAHLALGEIAYDQHNFTKALNHFVAIEKYPENRVFAYGLYKAAWTHYNLHDSDVAMEKLIRVADHFSKKNIAKAKTQHNLRTEALRDLALFFEETRNPEAAVSFFRQFCETEELDEQLINLAKLYDSHSRHKELGVLTAQTIKALPGGRAHLTLEIMETESLELQKNRPAVLVHLRSLQTLCLTPQGPIRDTCRPEVNRVTTEMAKHWWELWQKNKTHNEVAEWTLEAFELILKSEDAQHPDVRTRYADAELLFQLGRFADASRQYSQVAVTSVDSTVIQDSAYAALVAGEKAGFGTDKILELSQTYLTRSPQGEHVDEVRFKIGFLNYTAKNYPVALLHFQQLAKESKAREMRTKAEDLILDIYNATRNYKAIAEWTQQLLKSLGPNSQDRKAMLMKLQQEAQFAMIQDGVEKDPAGADKLRSFAVQFPQSPLTAKALWQALSLDNSHGNVIEAADQCQAYLQKFPQDEKGLQCLKAAAAAYADVGLLTDAAKTLVKLTQLEKSSAAQEKYRQLAVEAFALDGQMEMARDLVKPLLLSKDSNERSSAAEKLLTLTNPKKDQKLVQEMKQDFAHKGIEPFASLQKVLSIEELPKSQKWTEAFNSSGKLIGATVPQEARARANMVRALVYEHELVSQSTKTSVERLETVLAIKTEKLDRAQTTFTLVGKLSIDSELKLAALEGLQRCYQNFIESVGHPQIKNELSPAEAQLLTKELSKLTAPVVAKAKDLEQQILAAKPKPVVASREPASAAETAPVTAKHAVHLLPVTLAVQKHGPQNIFQLQKSDHCPTKVETNAQDRSASLEALTSATNRCLSLGNLDQAENWAREMARSAPQSPHGAFYLALIADEREQKAKAQYLFGLAHKKDPQNPVVAAFGGGQ